MQGHIWLAPPQLYELSRLAEINSAENLKIFSKKRQQQGIERWLPIRCKTKNGDIMTILPGRKSLSLRVPLQFQYVIRNVHYLNMHQNMCTHSRERGVLCFIFLLKVVGLSPTNVR